MRPTTKTLLGLTAALAMTATAAVGLAQNPLPGGAPPAGFGDGPGPGGRGSPEMREQILRQRLALRTDQEPALKAFLDSTRPPGGPGGPRGRAQARQMTTPERLDLQLAEMRQRVDATKRFYATLSPEQRQAFDAMPLGPDGRGGRGDGGGGRRGPGGGDRGFGAPPAQ
jgi:Spy/CpxP family protein refolding chaperone